MQQSNDLTFSSERNYGIDLLRIVAAFYVVLLHTMSLGGLMEAAAPGSYQQQVCNMLVILTYSAVNIFGIISGYVGYRDPQKKYTYHSYLSLWLTVVCYCVLYACIYLFIIPSPATKKELIQCFFPVSCDLYWYFSAYTVVYFMAPYLNKILHYSSDKELKQLLFLICCVFVMIEYISSPFDMGRGYSTIWLILLYLIGGILRKTGIGSKIPSYALFLGILMINISFFWVSFKQTSITLGIFTLNLKVRNAYITPFYLAPALLYVMLFSRFRFHEFWKKIIQFVAPAAFSVYIINTNQLLWNYTLRDRFVIWATSSPAGIFVRTILFSSVFVSAVVLIDFFRRKLFQLLGVQNWTKKLSCILQKEKLQ